MLENKCQLLQEVVRRALATLELQVPRIHQPTQDWGVDARPGISSPQDQGVEATMRRLLSELHPLSVTT